MLSVRLMIQQRELPSVGHRLIKAVSRAFDGISVAKGENEREVQGPERSLVILRPAALFWWAYEQD